MEDKFQYLFVDGSVNTKTKVGYGASLLLKDLAQSIDSKNIKTKKFEDTSSSKLELENLIWALNEIDSKDNRTIVYTDSQNIVGLLERREKLEKNNFISRNGKELKNKELYQKFYSICDSMKLEILKIKGHKASREKNSFDRIFSLVDKAARSALRSSS